MTDSRIFEHRAAIKRLTALAADRPDSPGLARFIEYHENQIALLEVTTGQESPSRALWPDKRPVKPEMTYPGGPDIRIDPPYDR